MKYYFYYFEKIIVVLIRCMHFYNLIKTKKLKKTFGQHQLKILFEYSYDVAITIKFENGLT